jgi:glycine/D-amino acid oxidase-like deaminating enzyme
VTGKDLARECEEAGMKGNAGRSSDVLVIGGGIFGITAALELRGRGFAVTVIDGGPIPHPLAASTDVSKVVRMEYGADLQYTRMADRAIEGFLGWNEEFDEELYVSTGVLMLARKPMQPGDYLSASYELLTAEGHRLDRLDCDALRRRFPAWRAETYVDGFFNPRGGYARSGRIVAQLANKAQRLGVVIDTPQTAAELVREGGRIAAVRTREGETYIAGHTLVAAGAWTHHLLPELQRVMVATGHPVFHLKPKRPELYAPPHFVTFTADVAATGWYGFPLLREGVVKLANHGVGVPLHAEHDPRVVLDRDYADLRAMLGESLPDLLDAEIVYTRRCLYSDTPDGHFWIDRHPQRIGLTVAAGDSGHGFNFAPVLGPLIADVVEGKSNDWASRFRWRSFAQNAVSQEAARHRA